MLMGAPRLLVTGFGPFGKFLENPAQRLAETCGFPHKILPVSYREVPDELDALDADSFDRLLMIGVAAMADKPRIEQVARNHVGKATDIHGETYGPGPIHPDAPPAMSGTLWSELDLSDVESEVETSQDAGGFLCNFVYFEALRRFPGKEIGFLHVPPADVMPIEDQERVLRSILGIAAR